MGEGAAAEIPAPRRWVQQLLLVAILLVAAVSLHRSWGLWPYMMIDVGRDLTVPQQILDGKKPYVDVQYLYPPAPAYVLALATSLFGHSLLSFTLIGLLISTITAATIYSVLYRNAGVAAASVATLLFVALNLAGASTWGSNYMFPYAHAATLGMMFVLLFLWSLLRFISQPEKAQYFAGLTLSAVLAALSKVEFIPVVAITFVVAAWIHRFPRRLILAAAAFTTMVLALLTLWFRAPGRGQHWILDNIFMAPQLGSRAARLFNAQVNGMIDAPGNVLRAVVSVLLLAVLLSAIRLAGRARTRTRSIRDVLLVAACAAAGSLATYYLADGLLFRGWIIVEFGLIAWLLLFERKNLLLPTCLVAFLCALRIALNLNHSWYGFFLVLPTYVVIAWTIFGFLPSRGFYSRRAALWTLPLFVLLCVNGQQHQASVWSRRAFPVVSHRGVTWETTEDKASALQAAVTHLERTKPSSLVVIPEGIGLNYLTGIPNNTRYHTFTPPVSGDDEMEANILANFDEVRPEVVAIVFRDVREFGHRGFGVDYNVRLAAWLKQHYHIRQQWLKPTYYVILLERNAPR